MARLSEWYGRLLDALVVAACVLLLLMTVMIGADVLSRNLGGGGVSVSNEISEDILYLMTLLAAPWLLRQGRHIRVDVLLRVIPKRLGWYCEWASDVLGLLSCTAMAVYGARAALASWKAGSMSVKTLVMPEWWLLAPLPVAFLLLAVEMLFRMQRLHAGERAPRDDAVSTG